MFSPDRREAVRERLLSLAQADPDVVGGAHTGSFALGAVDEWSDIDIALGVRGDVPPVVERWTRLLYESFGAVHHWDLPFGRTLYRVFLLPDRLEIDIAFAPEPEFGPRGPTWRLVFGTPAEPNRAGTVSTSGPDNTIGLGWHHVLHAAACIGRGKPWQAEWFIAQARHHVLELACRRFGLPDAHGRGTDQLPPEIHEAMAATLLGDLDERSLRRALDAVTGAFLTETAAVDPALADRLRPVCEEATSSGGDGPASSAG